LGEAFGPIVKEYGLGEARWSDSTFELVFGHCRLGVRATGHDNPRFEGFRSQSGVLTPETVADTFKTEVSPEWLYDRAMRDREDRTSKLIPIRDKVIFALNYQ